MSDVLAPLIQLQRFFIPGLVGLVVWAIWRAMVKEDFAVGLGLYLGLVIIVDSYLNTGIYLPGLDKGSVRYSEVWAILLIWRARPLATHDSRRLVVWPLVLYFLLLAASVLRADEFVPALFEFRARIASQVVALVLVSRGLKDVQAHRRFFACMALLVLVLATFTFWDLFFDRTFLKSSMLDKPIYAHNRENSRFGSFFLNPNYMGGFVALVFPATFMWAIQERGWSRRALAGAGLLGLIFCLVETQSRAPLLAVGIGIVLLLLGPAGKTTRTRRIGLVGGITTTMLVVMPGFFDHATGRFDKLSQETSTTIGQSRATTWIYTMRMIEDHPLGGIGFGEPQFLRAMEAYGFYEEYAGEPMDAPHNSYLQAAVYAGLPALTMFVIANLMLLGKAARWLSRSAGDANAPLVFGLMVGIIGFLASIYPDLQLFTDNVAPVYWTFFGLLLSLITRAANAVPKAAAGPRTAIGAYRAPIRPLTDGIAVRRTKFRTADTLVRGGQK